jgi:hypothetical protein
MNGNKWGIIHLGGNGVENKRTKTKRLNYSNMRKNRMKNLLKKERLKV